ncbi:1-(5-phosphoribosyl)-5-[(5-phosphoribosylamino)methylideneamino]imidazole-4-carboxamide isomerase [Campylobacter insulaenigrae]|uniref:1-(5-phosphoribosyl)-5-[(5-phosphoribosylamino)methylideneamino] imidazole-4-carboxamide isomerase n=1 Tax=Campylobacter insulaenigrae TaxID=260714 RepID=A0ABY3G8A6_9BACT|nr:1-(5-phosphoribosyl)-5-[(5-phosphoribosylamino)methylideneamino]imidazole-4-carboxamide isomerase [Campylobacter insulaenigrae]MCR6570645.1 1-(5-phosphoribosyl)-5-[(5-phosphoribosylamino)methylideneamino]imidazole-4-carboxamide isomerase [Campylobacter insulaenigrae]MCR6572207.1 1-(5-phosphoribosyl)-5-[(5-phosphoribosylamino)methylideneamino]imidazole-4-carboxamide isomerase [Campylobacter insulaenigrae]MCR6573964.1 1-(5-phosphoribosyl)-5-[(5-phosphoribosylamino)methylideneamino]imidazole-4-c
MQTQIIPALDLINGKVVRLYKGDYAKKQEYSYDPLAKFKEYEAQGALWLHLVDLDGAKDPSKRQLKLIEKLALNVKVNLQIGGGIRTKDEIKALFDCGIKRVVIGSLAVKDKKFTQELLECFGIENIVLALDSLSVNNEFFVSTDAWSKRSDESLFELLKFYKNLKHLLCTDISKDGTMSGANIALYKSLKEKFPHLSVQASGGVASLQDFKNLNGVVSGIIVGKALLDNEFSIKEAKECLQNA